MDALPQDLASAVQQYEPGNLVFLYQLDLSPIGIAEVLYFTKGGSVMFGGQLYAAVDVEVEGFEWNGQGALPQPTIRISNATRLISGALRTNQDIIGATLTRIKTFDQFLDGGSMADPTAIFAPDVYVINQKTDHDKFHVEFQLAAAMDQQGRLMPGRLILRNMCTFRYRTWDATKQAYDYTHATCPYTGTGAWDDRDNPTIPALDNCSKKIYNGCVLRFAGQGLPFGGFPGAALED